MRRKDKEIKDKDQIEQVIQDARVCHLAVADNGQPYVVPLNFGYRNGVVYFHSAREGRKIDMLKTNPRVCLAFSNPGKVVRGDTACKWGQAFESVIAFGEAHLVEGEDERRAGLDAIMAHYDGPEGEYPESKLKITTVIAVTINTMTGKRSG